VPAGLAGIVRRRCTNAGGRPNPAWSQVAIPVDGLPATFTWLAEGRDWVAYAELGDRSLVLQARDLPVDGVKLVRITTSSRTSRARAGSTRRPGPAAPTGTAGT
jgi:hypothetical protein